MKSYSWSLYRNHESSKFMLLKCIMLHKLILFLFMLFLWWAKSMTSFISFNIHVECIYRNMEAFLKQFKYRIILKTKSVFYNGQQQFKMLLKQYIFLKSCVDMKIIVYLLKRYTELYTFLLIYILKWVYNWSTCNSIVKELTWLKISELPILYFV